MTLFICKHYAKSRVEILLEIIENNEAAVKKKNFWNRGYSWTFSPYISLRSQDNFSFVWLPSSKEILTDSLEVADTNNFVRALL